jgi:hypothetical protein
VNTAGAIRRLQKIQKIFPPRPIILLRAAFNCPGGASAGERKICARLKVVL